MKCTNLLKRGIAIFASVVMVLTSASFPISSQVVYATGNPPTQEQISQLDDVTNLQWVEGSSATVSWTAAEEANYYAVTVDVYESDGTTFIGTATTGTTDTELDVQQEIHNVIGDAEYDTIKVTATVVAQKKQDDVVVAESDLVLSALLEYRLTAVIKLPTPYDVSLAANGMLKFKYDGDTNLVQVFIAQSRIEYNGVTYAYKTQHILPSQLSYENEYYCYDLSEAILEAYAFCVECGVYESGAVTNVCYDVHVASNAAGNADSDSSRPSNAIEYSGAVIKLPTPYDVSLTANGMLKFKYDGDTNLVQVFIAQSRIEYNGITYAYKTQHILPSQLSYENEYYCYDLSEAILEAYAFCVECGAYESGAVTNVCYDVHVASNAAGNADSDSSSPSNAIEYSGAVIKLPTPYDVSLTANGMLKFKYDGDTNLVQVFIAQSRIEYNGITYAYKTQHILPSQLSYENEYYCYDLSEAILEAYAFCVECGFFESGVVTNMCYDVHAASNAAGNANSDSSSPSNAIVYNGKKAVKSLTLAPRAPIVCKGNSYYLGKTIDPADAYYEDVDWSSDDTSIITVDEDGKITGVEVGTKNVTATIGDVTDTVPVTVYKLKSNISEQEGIDEDDEQEIIDTAGNIIDDIANNDDPNLSNTDIDENYLGNIQDEIHNGMASGYDFWVNFKWEGRGYGYYQEYWNISEFWMWYDLQFGNHEGWNFGYGYNIEYEIGYTDTNNESHHITNITDFGDNEYEFCLEIPEDLDKPGIGKKRLYKLVRYHNSQYEIIPTEVDGEGKMHGKSGKYSDFVLLYEDVNNTDDSETNSVLNAATITANNRTYDGTEKPLVIVDDSTLVGGTMYYALGTDTTTVPTTGYTTSIPAATDAGIYYVWYMVVGDDNHENTDPAYVLVQVKGVISATITFRVVNGSWNDGKTADKTVTLNGYEGDTLYLTAEQIPAVGTKAADTFKAGAWNVTPSADTAISKNTTYTYTYAKKDTISATVTFKVINGSWNDGTTPDKTVTLTGYEGDTMKLVAGQIPAVGTKAADTFKAGAWNVTPSADTTISKNTTYTYTYAKKDTISAIVTFKVVNGSWNDGTTADKTVTMIGYEGDTLKLAANLIPAVGTKANENYEAGSWDVTPSVENVISKNITYIYTYVKKSSEDNGIVKIPEEKEKDNFAEAGLDSSSKEIKDSVLTEEDKEIMESGKDISVWLVVTENNTDVSEQDRALIDNTRKENLGADYTVGSYLDLTLWKQVEGKEAIKIIEVPNGKVKVTMTIPENMRKTGAVYKIIRIHNGVTSIIDVTVDETIWKMTFETDAFSTYALVYAEEKQTKSCTLTINYKAADSKYQDKMPETYSEKVEAGKTYKVTVPAVEGFTPSVKYVSGTMENKDVSVTVTYKINQYKVSFVTNGGSGVKSQTVNYKEKATKPADPTKENYTFDNWYADEALTVVFDFDKTITADVTVYAKWNENASKEKVEEHFSDVPAGKWYVPAIQFVYDFGYMKGVAENLFAPDKSITREQFVTVLYNIEGHPAVEFKDVYTDVVEDEWYTDAVIWANKNGVAVGYKGGRFGVGEILTREQLATMLYNYAQYKKLQGAIKDNAFEGFPDSSEISEWALDGMTWSVGNEIINGKATSNGKNILDPLGKASRAECAQMMKNLFDNVINK